MVSKFKDKNKISISILKETQMPRMNKNESELEELEMSLEKWEINLRLDMDTIMCIKMRMIPENDSPRNESEIWIRMRNESRVIEC